jgi:hypothetical protein
VAYPRLRAPFEWIPTPSGIYFIDRTHTANSIAFFDFSAAKITRRSYLCGGLAVSSDGTWLAYSQIDQQTSNLMLVGRSIQRESIQRTMISAS